MYLQTAGAAERTLPPGSSHRYDTVEMRSIFETRLYEAEIVEECITS